MSKYDKSFYSKILLAGEYTVMTDGNAIAFPYKRFEGRFEFDEGKSSASLYDLLYYLQQNQLDIYIDVEKLRSDLALGMYFKSNIPYGYGLGSSGALVAALYNRYGKNKAKNTDELRRILGELESVFHGTSSGMDPLVSYLDQPVVFTGNQIKLIHQDSLNLSGFFLIDTGIDRSTSYYVEIFNNMKKNLAQYGKKIKKLESINRQLIQAILKNHNAEIAIHMEVLSRLQYDIFTDMIPDGFKNIWLKGLESGNYFLKLCGAGGGGMILGWSPGIDLDLGCTVLYL
ncbi:MAG TPA: hypothetical protein PK047_02010 [Saprospiraceae bacterium]|mgnify:CR=1 FL=1|nr:hypothetical protein [Saprospiraceae bacterium]HRO07611.1 hypothetical protein [Saprospiraceae bacterium]HRP40894.1 hypothetical protein [Saprospiraceae bacterium]